MSALLNPVHKFKVHVVQIIFIVAVLAISAARLLIQGGPRSRADTMALGMSAKSVIIISYQILTEHVGSLKRWGSLKANAILNGMEVVFWAAVVYLVIQSNTQRCAGITCTLSWVVMALGILMSLLSLYAAAISYVEFRRSRSDKPAQGRHEMEQSFKRADSVSV